MFNGSGLLSSNDGSGLLIIPHIGKSRIYDLVFCQFAPRNGTQFWKVRTITARTNLDDAVKQLDIVVLFRE